MCSIQLPFFPNALNYDPDVLNDLRLLGTALEGLYKSKENAHPPYPTAKEITEALSNISKSERGTSVQSATEQGVGYIKQDGLKAKKRDNPLTDIIINLSRLQAPIARLSKWVAEITKPELASKAFPTANQEILAQLHRSVTQVA